MSLFDAYWIVKSESRLYEQHQARVRQPAARHNRPGVLERLHSVLRRARR